MIFMYLAILTCTKRKIFQKKVLKFAKAKDAYIGSVFKLAKEYCETKQIPYVILSAKYGFLLPSDVISDYNISFKNKRDNVVSDERVIKTFERVLQYYKSQGLEDIVLLSFAISDDYQKRIELVSKLFNLPVVKPIYKLPIGKALQKIKSLLR